MNSENTNDLRNADETILNSIQSGIDAINLIQNTAWAKIIKELQTECLEALYALSTVSHKDEEQFYELQNKVWRYSTLVTKVDEIIKDADYAKQMEEELSNE